MATLSPFTSKRGLFSSPSTPAGPSTVLRVNGFAPSLPARPIEPSFPLSETEEPSLPLTSNEPSVPGFPSSDFSPSVILSDVAISYPFVIWVTLIFLPWLIANVSLLVIRLSS